MQKKKKLQWSSDSDPRFQKKAKKVEETEVAQPQVMV
jgi:hypothetical protein